MAEENIYLKLAEARVETQKRVNKKSGHNDYAGFDYYVLGDFLSQATEELKKVGLVATFNIKQDKKWLDNGQLYIDEKAELIITDGTNNIIFESPTANPNFKGNNEMQALGSKRTYLKRYLYLDALEIAEPDEIDATIGKEDDKKETPKETTKATPKATAKQVELINSLYKADEITTMLNALKVNSLEEVSIKDASTMISKRKNNAN